MDSRCQIRADHVSRSTPYSGAGDFTVKRHCTVHGVDLPENSFHNKCTMGVMAEYLEMMNARFKVLEYQLTTLNEKIAKLAKFDAYLSELTNGATDREPIRAQDTERGNKT